MAMEINNILDLPVSGKIWGNEFLDLKTALGYFPPSHTLFLHVLSHSELSSMIMGQITPTLSWQLLMRVCISLLISCDTEHVIWIKINCMTNTTF